jgi:hypothetical protein
VQLMSRSPRVAACVVHEPCRSIVQRDFPRSCARYSGSTAHSVRHCIT